MIFLDTHGCGSNNAPLSSNNQKTVVCTSQTRLASRTRCFRGFCYYSHVPEYLRYKLNIPRKCTQTVYYLATTNLLFIFSICNSFVLRQAQDCNPLCLSGH